MASPRHPNLAWFIAGAVVSGLGDQFTLIALPWLVLRLTGDPVLLGSAVALMGLPRAVMILFGGALADRYSPRRVLMLTKYVNTVLLGLLAILVWAGHATLPLVFALGLAMSVASAFGIPAGTSMLPHVVEPARLRAANGMLMGVRQITLLAGPMLAGLLFALAGDGSRGGDMRDGDMHGLALAFGFDAVSFAVSAWTLARVILRRVDPAPPEPVLRAVANGLALVWRDPLLRTGFVYWGLCSCVVGGIVQVALPLLAATRLSGASALGLLAGAHGAGALVGMAWAGTASVGTARQRFASLGTLLLALDAAIGLLLPLLGSITATWQGMLVNLAIGGLGGLANVTVFTWIQARVPQAMLGRTMGLFMFVVLGLAPLAAAAGGWLAAHLTLGALFAGAGGFLVVTSMLAWLCTPMRAMSDAPLPRGDRVA